MDDVLSHVSVLAELERIGMSHEWAAEDEVRVLCPFHDDTAPSCLVNVKKRVFKCHVAGCEREGDFLTLMAQRLHQSRSVIVIELARRYGLEVGKIVDPNVVERYHDSIWTAYGLLAELRKRGVDEELIRRYRLGATEDGRISIPVPGRTGLYVNIRRYLPGAPGREKMKNQKGYGKTAWWPVEQLKYQNILYCGGEMKAAVAARQLNPHGWGAICQTAGEGNLDLELLKDLAGKTLAVCLDIDFAGRQAAKTRCQQLHFCCDAVYGPIVLPLDASKHPNGDINDFVAAGGDLWPLVEAAAEWSPETERKIAETTPEDTDLRVACTAASAGKRVRVRAVVSAVGEAPYIIPKTVVVKCDKSQRECAICPVYIASDPTFPIHPEAAALLEMIDSSKKSVRDGLCEAIGVPRTCRVVEYDATEYYNVEDARVSPQLDITSRTSDRLMQPASCIGFTGLEPGESYMLTGRMHPHPDTQQSTLLISSYEPTQDALTTYEARDIDQLVLFQPEEWTVGSIRAKLDEVYTDLEANVTHIFKRRDTHLFVDLCYHSVLNMPFDGKTHKGWVETLIIGDSSCGKSEVACGARGDAGLMVHYGLGERVDCKGATPAGLLGGLQQLSGRFFVAWGLIPMHDRRILHLEEIKGMKPGVISSLTDMRSSGRAQIPKIEKRMTHARTRLNWISNPPFDRPMSSFSFGVEAVRDLIGNPEDIRRFDAALIVTREDIPAEEINVLQNHRPVVPPKYTSRLCRSLVLWAWTRREHQVQFDDDATALALAEATALSGEYSDAIPLIDRGSTRLKVARLSASLACRTFSCDEADPQVVRVRRCHVEFIAALLRRVYSGPVFGYDAFSRTQAVNEEVLDPEMIKKKLASLPYPRDFCANVLRTTKIDMQDVQDWCSWERMEVNELVSFLVRKHAFIRDGRQYRKTSPFIRMLKGLLENGALGEAADGRPDHVKEEY